MSTIKVVKSDYGPDSVLIRISIQVQNAFKPSKFATKWQLLYNVKANYLKYRDMISGGYVKSISEEENITKDPEILGLVEKLVKTEMEGALIIFAIALDSKLSKL